jgi:Protein of unknown function (DUF3296).
MTKTKSTIENGSKKEIEIITKRYQTHLEDMISKHSKVLQTRFDLRYPKNYNNTIDTTSHISNFLDNLVRDLKRNVPLPKPGMARGRKETPQVHDPDPRIIWVKENHGGSNNPHYHCLTLVNGNAKKSGDDIQKRAKRQWDNVVEGDSTEGLVDFCYRQGGHSTMLNRNAPDFEIKMEQAKKQASYLSKQRGKENSEKGSWNAGGTRPPKRDI